MPNFVFMLKPESLKIHMCTSHEVCSFRPGFYSNYRLYGAFLWKNLTFLNWVLSEKNKRSSFLHCHVGGRGRALCKGSLESEPGRPSHREGVDPITHFHVDDLPCG